VDQLIMDIDAQGQRLVDIISEDPFPSRSSEPRERPAASKTKKKVA
jgi:hypothetical protein